jgi:hypothetical protein
VSVPPIVVFDGIGTGACNIECVVSAHTAKWGIRTFEGWYAATAKQAHNSQLTTMERMQEARSVVVLPLDIQIQNLESKPVVFVPKNRALKLTY